MRLPTRSSTPTPCSVDPAPIARGPDAMWQLAHGYRSHLREIVGAEDLDLVPAADGDIGKHPVGIAHDVDVIGDRASVQGLEQREGRLGIKYLGLTGVFEREPHLAAIRCRRKIGAEWAGLDDPPDEGMICHRDDYGLRVERRTDVAVFAVWRENLHPRTGRHLDPRSFHESASV